MYHTNLHFHVSNKQVITFIIVFPAVTGLTGLNEKKSGQRDPVFGFLSVLKETEVK